MERPIKEGLLEVLAGENLIGKEQRLVALVAGKRGLQVVIAQKPEDVDAVLVSGAPKGELAKVYPLHRGAAVRVEVEADVRAAQELTLGTDGMLAPLPTQPGKYAVLMKSEESAVKGECPYCRLGLVWYFETVSAANEPPKA